MGIIFLLLSFVSFIVSFLALIVGLVKPTVFSRFIKGDITRKRVAIIFGSATLVLIYLFIITVNSLEDDQAIEQPITQNAKVNTTATSAEEATNTQTKLDDSKKYRIVNGFKLTYENMILGVLVYHYETNDGVYSVDLQIEPKVTDLEFDNSYTLANGSLQVNGIDIQYAFNKGTKTNDIEIDKSYESAEFVFIKGDKTYTGFVRKNKEVDRVGIESTLKLFVNALVSNISNNK